MNGIFMPIRTFFSLLFIIAGLLLLLLYFLPEMIINTYTLLFNHHDFSIQFVQILLMVIASLALIGLLVSNYYIQKIQLVRQIKEAENRLNIEIIHAELEALRQ